MTLVRTSLLNAVAVAIRMVSALVLNKVLAVSVGPSGFALIGQLQNAVNILNTFATAATAQGITKYTAEYAGDPARLHAFWRTAGTVVLSTALVTAAVTIVASPWLAYYFLHDRAQGFVFVILGIGLVLLSVNAFLIAVLQGLKDVGAYVVSNIAGSVIGLAFIVGATLAFGVRGALAALAINQSLAVGVTVWLCRRREWFSWRRFSGALDRRMVVDLSGFVAMAASSAITGSVAQVAVRSHLIALFGRARAGEWEGMMRISSLYLLFFTSTLAVYFLPRVSEMRRSVDLSAEVLRLFRIMVPLVVLGSAAIFLTRDLVIRLLFDPAFHGMRDLFAWQMIGDTFKALGWIFSYTMIGRAMAGWYIGSELLFNAGWVAISFAAIGVAGFSGVGIGYALSYALYFAAIVAVFFRLMRTMRRSEFDGAAIGLDAMPQQDTP